MSREIEKRYPILKATYYGAIAQAGGEALGIVFPDWKSEPSKFPLGWESYNIFEEIIEGGAPALVGAVVGRACYRIVSQDKYDATKERAAIYIGAVLGYSTMGIVGAILHEHFHVSDIKWGPFQ